MFIEYSLHDMNFDLPASFKQTWDADIADVAVMCYISADVVRYINVVANMFCI